MGIIIRRKVKILSDETIYLWAFDIRGTHKEVMTFRPCEVMSTRELAHIEFAINERYGNESRLECASRIEESYPGIADLYRRIDNRYQALKRGSK